MQTQHVVDGKDETQLDSGSAAAAPKIPTLDLKLAKEVIQTLDDKRVFEGQQAVEARLKYAEKVVELRHAAKDILESAEIKKIVEMQGGRLDIAYLDKNSDTYRRIDFKIIDGELALVLGNYVAGVQDMTTHSPGNDAMIYEFLERNGLTGRLLMEAMNTRLYLFGLAGKKRQ